MSFAHPGVATDGSQLELDAAISCGVPACICSGGSGGRRPSPAMGGGHANRRNKVPAAHPGSVTPYAESPDGVHSLCHRYPVLVARAWVRRRRHAHANCETVFTALHSPDTRASSDSHTAARGTSCLPVPHELPLRPCILSESGVLGHALATAIESNTSPFLLIYCYLSTSLPACLCLSIFLSIC